MKHTCGADEEHCIVCVCVCVCVCAHMLSVGTEGEWRAAGTCSKGSITG